MHRFWWVAVLVILAAVGFFLFGKGCMGRTPGGLVLDKMYTDSYP